MLYVAWALLWGIPSIAGLIDLAEDDEPPLVSALFLVIVALTFFAFVLLLQLVAYLAILYRIPRRRLAAILLFPLAVGVMFAFATDGVVAAVLVALAGASYGASVWFPHGPPAWWQGRPLLVAVAALTWLAITGTVALVQPRAAGIEADVEVTVHDGERTARYRLACEYDRAGRVRGAAAVPGSHPGGRHACELLDHAAETLVDGPPLQRGCRTAGVRFGTFDGTVDGRPFRQRIVAGECTETAFVDGEVGVLVPSLRRG